MQFSGPGRTRADWQLVVANGGNVEQDHVVVSQFGQPDAAAPRQAVHGTHQHVGPSLPDDLVLGAVDHVPGMGEDGVKPALEHVELEL